MIKYVDIGLSVWICVYVDMRGEREKLAAITNVTDNLFVRNCRKIIGGAKGHEDTCGQET